MKPIFTASRWAGLIAGPVLFAICGPLLQSAGISPPASWAAASALWMACWWILEPVPLWATACLPLLVFPLLKIERLWIVALQYFDPINFLFLGGMLIAASMQQWGLHRRIALNIVMKLGTSPRRLVLGFMVATAFISLWISNTATAVMMFPIAMALLLKFGEDLGPDDPLLRRFGLALMLGIAYAANIGGIGTKIGTGPNLIFVKHAAGVLPGEIDFVTWLKVGLPIVFIALPAVWFYLVRMVAKLPADGFSSSNQMLKTEIKNLGAMRVGEKIALVAFLSAAFLWVFKKDMKLFRVFSRC